MPTYLRNRKCSHIRVMLAFVIGVAALLGQQPATAAGDTLEVCSFNVQFLGSSARRRNSTLAKLVKDCDIVVIQELVAPPFDGSFPDGSAFKPDPEAGAFFGAMKSFGFEFVLSEEDTGTGPQLHVNSSATEWYVTFYKPSRVQPTEVLPHGFLAESRADHDDFERVPYAFSFRTANGNLDFVLISVHLKPNKDSASKARRKHELASIAAWIDAHDEVEKDFIILGDMNIEDECELQDATPAGFVSLNNECVQTNTNQRAGTAKPYDHVMFRPAHSTEIDNQFDFKVIDLIAATRGSWNDSDGEFPGDPYDHNRFRAYFSDHHPVRFRFNIPDQDDD